MRSFLLCFHYPTQRKNAVPHSHFKLLFLALSLHYHTKEKIAVHHTPWRFWRCFALIHPTKRNKLRTSHTCFPFNIYTEELLLRTGQAAAAAMLAALWLREPRRWTHRAFHSSDGSKISILLHSGTHCMCRCLRRFHTCQACVPTHRAPQYWGRRELTRMCTHTCPYRDTQSLARSHSNASPPRALEVDVLVLDRIYKRRVHDVFDRNYEY